MGIPSYYKRLSSSIKNLVIHHRNDGSFKASTLLFDFNCMIYQVLRSSTTPPFPGYNSPQADEWETNLCQSVAEYTVKVWKELGKPSTVFLGLDGVVPMAKIRQQRMRRFKSIWTAKEERSRGLRDPTQISWDTNAITPGTAFMEKLGARLSALCNSHGWTLSDASQPGEGEQKCMQFWKDQKKSEGNLVLYGLDADLILLCLLTKQLTGSSANVWCFRETAEWEGGKEKGLAEFMRLSIDVLHQSLANSKIDPLRWTLDYVAGMSFLGNDFVPHGITLKIREGGHDRLLDLLNKLHMSGKFLTTQNSDGKWTYDISSVLIFVKEWSKMEERKLLDFIKTKATRVNHEDWQMTPCSWKVEEKLLCQQRGVLWNDWEDRMILNWFGPGVTSQQACKLYCEGLQWVLDYYTHQDPVNSLWMYPWSLPPTWRSLEQFLHQNLQNSNHPFVAPKCSEETQIKPQEQLAMVLPLESWQLLRNPTLQKAPTFFPYLWPTSYGFFSAGKLFLWECEAEIPLLSLPALRSVCMRLD